MLLYRVPVTALLGLACSLLAASPGLAAPPPAPRGELRVVDTSQGQWAWPTVLYAASRAVAYDPSATTVILFKDALVTDQHWSVRKTGTKR